MGDRERARGGDEAAIPFFERAIELDPGVQSFYLLLAALTGKQGNVAEAEALLRTAMDMDPCGIKPRIQLANLMASERRYAEQLAVLDAGIEHCEGSTATAFRTSWSEPEPWTSRAGSMSGQVPAAP